MHVRAAFEVELRCGMEDTRAKLELAKKSFAWPMHSWAKLLIAALAITQISTTAAHQPFVDRIEEYVCKPCAHLLNAALVRLPESHGPCLHEGQPVLRWPRSAQCPWPNEFHSEDLSLDPESGIAFAKRRVCLHSAQWMVSYRFRCTNESGSWQASTIRIGHQRFDGARRVKRWLRRRNPKHSPIHFLQDRYVAEVREDVEVRTAVVRVQATHAGHQPLYYTLSAPEDARSANLFALDTVSGEIRVAKALDRELLARHVLKVSAYERLDPQVAATTTVVVDLLDVQDNRPVFEKESYFAEIRENCAVGTTVLGVFARDLDAGRNGEVTYSLEGEPDHLRLFAIHPTSGVIQTTAEVDRERVSFARLKAVATDGGEPPLRSEAVLEIGVADANDNAPRFERDAYNVTVQENVTVPVVVLTVNATDLDFGPNGEVRYSIVTSSTVGLFALDYQSGELTLRAAPDPHQSPHSLLVRAKDLGQPAQSSTVHVTVHIIDVNDHAPAFLGQGLQEIGVDEGVPVGHELGRLLATDEDSGKNGEVRYRLVPLGPDANVTHFAIDALSGVLRTAAVLDRELADRYEFGVEASDQGSPPLSARIKVGVRVNDVNDNAPRFAAPNYTLTVSEQAPKGAQLLELRAHDADLDQTLAYRIESATRPNFALISTGEPGGGVVLSLTRPFAPADDLIRLVVSVTDQGGLRSFTNVTIHVVDENSAPVFVDVPISVVVSEMAPVGSPVVQIKARDLDRGDNANLQFSIDSTDFSIDNETGLITVKQSLDREKKSTYSLTITVVDSGVPPMSATTVLEVQIEDVNDNAPKFLLDEYKVKIKEDMPVGTSFLQVQALDADEGENGALDYFLNETDEFVKSDCFRLDQTSGLLRIYKELDRETTETFILPVYAKDRGNPPQVSHATIIVELEDVNDNPPVFEKPSYDLWIAENSPVGSVVGTLVAHDADVGANARIDFQIFGGADAKLFDIEADGRENGVARVRSRAEFDYEARTNKFFVEVRAASGQLSTTVLLTIHVSDVNDNQPQLADFGVLVAHFADEPAANGVPVGTIPAFDPDQNATLEFYLEPNHLLEAEPFTGALRLKNKWKRQLNSQHKVCVSDGPNTVCAKCTVIYVAVDENALANSVSLEVLDLNRDSFLEANTFDRFLATITSLDPTWLPEDVRVFAIDAAEVGGRPRLNVSLFVSKGEMAVSPHLIEQADPTQMTALFNSQMRVLKDDLCLNEPCPYYQQCKRTLRHSLSAQPKIIETDNFIFRSLSTIQSFTCSCPNGFATSLSKPGICNERVDLCFNNPCMNNGTCIPLETSFRCECNPGRTGERCELSALVDTCLPSHCFSAAECRRTAARSQQCHGCRWGAADADARCRLRAASFGGDAHLALPHDIGRVAFALRLRFSTANARAAAVLLFAAHSADVDNAAADRLELALAQGVPRLRASLGGAADLQLALPDWRDNRVADGEWHTLHLTYQNWTFRMWLDDCDPELSLRFASAIGYAKCAVEGRIALPERCADPAVPCHRFLDLGSALYLGARPGHTADGFVGCLKDLHINGRLVHFSDFDRLEKVGDVQAGCRRFRPDHCAMQKALSAAENAERELEVHVQRGMMDEPCHPSARCVDKWEGRVCKCAQRVHSHRSCAMETAQPIQLLSEESHVVWTLPAAPKDRVLYFEFRTRERKTQIMVLEFELKHELFVFSLESGHGAIRYGSEQFYLMHPELADGDWHSVRVDFDSDTLIVDHILAKSLKSSAGGARGAALTAQLLYSGNAPSMAYPQEFIGCVRNVEYGGVKVKPHEQSRTKPGCGAANSCLTAQCPTHSQCVRQWDRHECRCHAGYVGDSCLDVCAVRGVCNQGLCIRSNGTQRGYECACPDGLGGANCEQPLLEQACPGGWFGQFRRCRKCECNPDRGFLSQCGRADGKCQCKPGFYRKVDRCVPCECGTGAQSEHCDAETGQCRCAGAATGRRCDRCARSAAGRAQLLERKTLRCVEVRDRCAAEVEEGIQWATTVRGVVARQSCAGGQMGIATRLCGADGAWAAPRTRNCTLPALFDLQQRVEAEGEAADALGLLLQLRNATGRDAHWLRGRNLDLALGALAAVVRRSAQVAALHAADHAFARHVLRVADQLLGQRPDAVQFLALLSRLYEFGAALARTHADIPSLRPFAFRGDQLYFAIDVVQAGGAETAQFPRPVYAVSDEPAGRALPVLQVPARNASLFYAFVRPQCAACGHGDVVLVKATPLDEDAARGKAVVLTFKRSDAAAEDGASWRYPECVQAAALERQAFEAQRAKRASAAAAAADDDLTIGPPGFVAGEDFSNDALFDWSQQQSGGAASLTGLNQTHAQCRFAQLEGVDGVFTLLSRADPGAFVSFSLAGGGAARLPYTAPLCAAFALFLLLVAVLVGACKRDVSQRHVRVAFMLAFVLNAAVLFAAPRLHFSQLYCALKVGLLAYSVTGEFVWLFILTLCIYKVMVEERAESSCVFSLLVGLVCPCVACTAAFIFTDSCTLSLKSRSLWLVAGPMALFLVLAFYALATSFLVSCSNHYDVVAAKHGVRKVILIHSTLLLLCTAHVAIALAHIVGWNQSPLLTEGASSVAVVFVAIYIFIWTCFWSTPRNPVARKPEFWLNESGTEAKKFLGPGAMQTHFRAAPAEPHSPLLPQASTDSSDAERMPSYNEAVNEYMADYPPPAATYVHHTLQRSLQLHNSILSPVPPLPRPMGHPMDALECSPYGCRSPAADAASLRAGSMRNVAEGALRDSPCRSRYGSAVDEMNDTYYTFTGRRKRSVQPCSTFS